MTDRRITDIARTVRKKMEGGRLFGKLIDPKNEDEVLAAAFMLGKEDARSNRKVRQ